MRIQAVLFQRRLYSWQGQCYLMTKKAFDVIFANDPKKSLLEGDTCFNRVTIPAQSIRHMKI